jgi:hypothetical protein
VGDPNGLEDPATTAGSTVEATSRCLATRSVPLKPSWDLIAGWLHLALP